MSEGGVRRELENITNVPWLLWITVVLLVATLGMRSCQIQTLERRVAELEQKK